MGKGLESIWPISTGNQPSLFLGGPKIKRQDKQDLRDKQLRQSVIYRDILLFMFILSDNMEHEKLTERIIGCAMTVPRALGPGFLESVYQNALAHELRKPASNSGANTRSRSCMTGLRSATSRPIC